MARVHAEIATPWPAQRALGFVADFENLPSWDPSALAVVRKAGTGVAIGSCFDVTVRFGGRRQVYRYEITHSDASRVRLVAESRALRLEDTVHVNERPGGSRLTYDAEISLRGIARVAGPFVSLGFSRLAANALRGLRRELEAGE